jgi:AcrR family transcriptional regulator
MTHGSLYSHFDSKEHLATEALGRAFDASAAKYDEVETPSAYVERYLSPRHRDIPGSGCAIATLGCSGMIAGRGHIIDPPGCRVTGGREFKSPRSEQSN